MLKQAFKIIALFIGVAILTYGLHTNFFLENGPFRAFLTNTYLFHFTFSLVLVLSIQFLSKQDSLKNSLGIVYLAMLFVKMGLFVLLFKEPLFAEEETPKSELLSLLIPFFLSLLLEVYFIAKILTKIDTSNNIR